MTRTGKFPFAAEPPLLINYGAAKLVLGAPSSAFLGEEKFGLAFPAKISLEHIQQSFVGDGVGGEWQFGIHQQRAHPFQHGEINEIAANQPANMKMQ